VDDLTKEQRHKNMLNIRSIETKPEVIVRKYLFSKGYRFRKNDKRFAGKPDIVMPKYKTIIFINGCFWHQHEGCKRAAMPKDNYDYWAPKLTRNKERDSENKVKLELLGWTVIVIWECELSRGLKDKTIHELCIKLEALGQSK